MMKTKVLLVEDEPTLAMIIRDTLEAQGFEMLTAGDGEEGLRLIGSERPHIVVADVMMPRMDGFEMVRRMRQTDRLTPVLFLTARSAVGDVVEGFKTGGDDYLRKPFGMQELIVRIEALVSRTAMLRTESTANDGDTVMIGPFRLDTIRQQLILDAHIEDLSYREAEILRMLAASHNKVVETRDILMMLWGDDSFFNARSLQVFITKLRRKLAKAPDVKIINVRGVGYKLICD